MHLTNGEVGIPRFHWFTCPIVLANWLTRSFVVALPCPIIASRYAREKGYVCTLTGRRRHLPEINNAHSATLKAQAERQAVNSVIQVLARNATL